MTRYRETVQTNAIVYTSVVEVVRRRVRRRYREVLDTVVGAYTASPSVFRPAPKPIENVRRVGLGDTRCTNDGSERKVS